MQGRTNRATEAGRDDERANFYVVVSSYGEEPKDLPSVQSRSVAILTAVTLSKAWQGKGSWVAVSFTGVLSGGVNAWIMGSET